MQGSDFIWYFADQECLSEVVLRPRRVVSHNELKREFIMAKQERYRSKLQELVARDWDVEAITARSRRLIEHGIPQKTLSKAEILANKAEILDRVQRRGEEYEYLSHS